MRRDQALHILSSHKEELARMGVTSIAIFGSVARDEARPDSDVDVLVEIDHEHRAFGLFAFVRLRRRLGELLGCRVDLATPAALHPAMKDRILQEAIRAA